MSFPWQRYVYDFFDQLKSGTKGYASLDYEIAGYRTSNLVKMDILLNGGETVDALSFIVHRDKSASAGPTVGGEAEAIDSPSMFEVPVQAAIGNKVVARETIRAQRKDVLAKCYGGDISRKRKLLEKQKEGKKE